MIPIRCFTCGKVIADKWERYQALLKEGAEQNELSEGEVRKRALDTLGLRRMCCRRILLTHVEVIDHLLAYHAANQESLDAQ